MKIEQHTKHIQVKTIFLEFLNHAKTQYNLACKSVNQVLLIPSNVNEKPM